MPDIFIEHAEFHFHGSAPNECMVAGIEAIKNNLDSGFAMLVTLTQQGFSKMDQVYTDLLAVVTRIDGFDASIKAFVDGNNATVAELQAKLDAALGDNAAAKAAVADAVASLTHDADSVVAAIKSGTPADVPPAADPPADVPPAADPPADVPPVA